MAAQKALGPSLPPQRLGTHPCLRLVVPLHSSDDRNFNKVLTPLVERS